MLYIELGLLRDMCMKILDTIPISYDNSIRSWQKFWPNGLPCPTSSPFFLISKFLPAQNVVFAIVKYIIDPWKLSYCFKNFDD